MARTIAIGDVHGCHIAFDALLDLLAPHTDDTIVILGDVVDRGPGSRQCLERILRLREECKVVYVEGNHEEWMLRWLEGEGVSWFGAGGHSTLASYPNETVPDEHVALLRSTVDLYETGTHVFVHANWQPGCDDPPDSDMLRWCAMAPGDPPHPLGKQIVCGHTSQKDGRPATIPGRVCIDTFAHGGRWLTALDVDASTVYRADQTGRTDAPRPLDDVARMLA